MLISAIFDALRVSAACCAILLLPTLCFGQWIEQLPKSVRASVLWFADHEHHNLDQWLPPEAKYPGGGVLNTGDADAHAVITDAVAHSGRWSVAATISDAVRATNGKRAVRLMRWTQKPWDQGGEYFPKVAYYSTWMYLPHQYNSNKYSPWDPGDGGWWNVFQFKANDENDVSTSMFSLSPYHNDDRQQLEFGLNSHYGDFVCHEQASPIAVPIRTWFHVEARYEVSANRHGAITVWQDGRKIFDLQNVRTALTPKNENAVWGIGNYTDHIAGGPVEGKATIYFDDAVISLEPVSGSIQTTNSKSAHLNKDQK